MPRLSSSKAKFTLDLKPLYLRASQEYLPWEDIRALFPPSEYYKSGARYESYLGHSEKTNRENNRFQMILTNKITRAIFTVLVQAPTQKDRGGIFIKHPSTFINEYERNPY